MDTSTFPKVTLIPDNLENQTEGAASVSPAGGSEGCFIDPQLAFIVVASFGSLMLVLIISVLVLACKVFALKRQCPARRHNRNNVDVRGSSHWSTERTGEGIVGPCETNLLLEEVRPDPDDAAVQEEDDEQDRLHQSNTKNKDEANVLVTMQSSTSRDSCIDPAKQLEDMPLVV
ncbi:hypothetical protein Baya_9138 [Bagarius yarrelli]|uniref:Protein EVI2A n=1 Tax=Bagarius yarrelli TaxID=175774 RepID=A0A556U6T4_BAGYA|nr:hypothetical protein Baya_9138 [Bagarius yarrelli]